MTVQRRVTIYKFGKEGKGSYGFVIPSDMIKDSTFPIDLKRSVFLRIKKNGLLLSNEELVKR